jgi:predicted nucleotidyltransferase
MKSSEYHSIWEKRKVEENKKRDLAIERAREVAKILKERYKVKEVILFGSLVWRRDFLWRGTDIDLLVKGLRNANYFEALADISEISHPFHVDLIPFEKAWPSMKERALREGLRFE